MYSKEKSWLSGPGKDVVMLWGERSMKTFHSLQLPCHAAGETEAQTGIGANPNLGKKVSGRVRKLGLSAQYRPLLPGSPNHCYEKYFRCCVFETVTLT